MKHLKYISLILITTFFKINNALAISNPNVLMVINGCKSLLGDPKEKQYLAYWLQFSLNIMKYIAIVALLVLSTADFLKAVVEEDKDALRKVLIKTGKRFLYCIMIFFLPIIINTLLHILGIYDNGTCEIG